MSYIASRSLKFVVLAVSLNACSPTLNWRETRIDDTGLIVLFPCRPDRLTRSVAVAGKTIDMHLTACDAGGASFAVSHAEFAEGRAAQQGLAEWRKATLANMAADAVAESPIGIQQAAAPDGRTLVTPVKAVGKQVDGSVVTLNGVWFVRANRVFHAAIYAPKVTAEMSDTFFSGLGFQ